MEEKRYYYKRQDGKGTWNLKTPLSETKAQEYGAIEITEAEWKELQPIQKPYVPTAEEKAAQEKKARIIKLKAELAATDYVVIKIAESDVAEEIAALRQEYASIIAHRKEVRAQINELEGE